MTGPTQTYPTHPEIESQASLKLERNPLRTNKRQLSFTQWAEATDSLSGRWHRIKTRPKIKTAQVNAWMTEPHGPLKEAGLPGHPRPALSTERQAAHLAWVALPRHHVGGEGAGVLLNTVWRRGSTQHSESDLGVQLLTLSLTQGLRADYITSLGLFPHLQNEGKDVFM